MSPNLSNFGQYEDSWIVDVGRSNLLESPINPNGTPHSTSYYVYFPARAGRVRVVYIMTHYRTLKVLEVSNSAWFWGKASDVHLGRKEKDVRRDSSHSSPANRASSHGHHEFHYYKYEGRF